MDNIAAFAQDHITPGDSGSVWRDVGNVFLTPAETFRSIAMSPRWLVPILIIILSSIVYQAVIGGVRMEDMRRRIQNSSELSASEIEQRVSNIDAQRAQGFAFKQVLMGVAGLGILESLKLFGLTTALWLSLYLFNAPAKYRTILSLCGFCSLVVIPQFILKTPLILLKHTMLVDTGPAVILSADMQGSLLYNLLANFDVFVIWKVVLVAFGLHLLTGVSKFKASACIGYLWCVWILLTTLLGDLIQVT